jgi:transposase
MKRRRESANAFDAVPGSASAPRWRPPSVDRTTRLLQADPSTLGDEDRRFLDRLRADAPVLTESAALAARFADIVRRRSSESLEAWFEAAATAPLARFVAGLRREVEALQGAIATPWSTSSWRGRSGG